MSYIIKANLPPKLSTVYVNLHPKMGTVDESYLQQLLASAEGNGAIYYSNKLV